jgi:hypothetical protein
MNGNPADFRDVLWEAISTNRPYDAVCDSTRARFLYFLIKATKEPEFYVPRVCEVLTHDHYEDVSGARSKLARFLANDGHVECRDALLAIFIDSLSKGELVGATQIVALDGVAGLRFVIHATLDQAIDSRVFDALTWRPRWILEALCESHGSKLEARKALQSAVIDDSVNRWFRAIVQIARRSRLLRQETRRARHKPVPAYSSMRAAIEEDRLARKLGIRVAVWTVKADDKTLEMLAKDLLAETDPIMIAQRLRGFSNRVFPLDITKLLEWATSDDEGIRKGARRGLRIVNDQRVRDLCYRLIDTDPEPESLVQLLTSSFEPGDEAFLDRILSMDLVSSATHTHRSDIRTIIEKHWPPRSVEFLERMFETEHCGKCRASIYKLLADRAAVPEWMRREAVYDADAGLREMAAVGGRQ